MSTRPDYPGPGPITVRIRTLDTACFALVMATGILAISAFFEGMRALAAALTRPARPRGSVPKRTSPGSRRLRPRAGPGAVGDSAGGPDATTGSLAGCDSSVGFHGRHHRVVHEAAATGSVFCVDEKSAIQALDRLDPVLPPSPGRAERHGFRVLPAWHALAVCGPGGKDRLLVALPRPTGGPLRTPPQADQHLPDVTLVIANAEFLLDQMGKGVSYPMASPRTRSRSSCWRSRSSRKDVRPARPDFCKCRLAFLAVAVPPIAPPSLAPPWLNGRLRAASTPPAKGEWPPDGAFPAPAPQDRVELRPDCPYPIDAVWRGKTALCS